MGKNLRGKECGKGILQRKDGLYSARLVTHTGRRVERYFSTLAEAKNWIAESKYQEATEQNLDFSDMTVDEWFDFWINNIVCDLAPNTIRNYRERYIQNIKQSIGKMQIGDVKPLHCKMILNKMSDSYAGSTIRQTYITMGVLFKSALLNDVISKHPMNGVTFSKPIRASNDIHYLTVDEQRRFLEVARRSHNYNQYALILETGLRTGELIGLTWDSIDWDNRMLTVNKTLEYRYDRGYWRAGPPKSQAGYRTIPLTDKAYEILKGLYDNRTKRKESDLLSTTLDYPDRRTGETKRFTMKNLVFINYRTGEPTKNSSYDTHLYKLCDEAGIERFCMHALRHTYATRAIEYGVQPKVLQQLLGHSNIKMTMDRYVHVTEESMLEAVQNFGQQQIIKLSQNTVDL